MCGIFGFIAANGTAQVFSIADGAWKQLGFSGGMVVQETRFEIRP